MRRDRDQEKSRGMQRDRVVTSIVNLWDELFHIKKSQCPFGEKTNLVLCPSFLQVCEILTTDFGMHCLPLTVAPTATAAAGSGQKNAMTAVAGAAAAATTSSAYFGGRGNPGAAVAVGPMQAAVADEEGTAAGHNGASEELQLQGGQAILRTEGHEVNAFDSMLLRQCPGEEQRPQGLRSSRDVVEALVGPI
jgi:hypothetical protein